MKKTLFALACVLTLALTSCFKNTGFKQTADFARIVTVQRNASPLQLDADYTGEVFKLENLTVEEQLSLFGLENADRAIAYIHFETDEDYKGHFTLNSNGTKPIKVSAVWNKALPVTDKINPLSDLYAMQLDNSFSYPLAWMAGRYLNIAPVIRSKGLGTYYLMPKAVYGDTLRFDMAAEYTEAADGGIVDFINFDLTTLSDSLGSDDATLSTVRNMLDVIDEKDSVCVMVVSDFRAVYHKADTLADGTVKYEQRDTVVKQAAYAGYSSQLKSLLK